MDSNKQLLLKMIKARNETEIQSILECDPLARSLSWWPFNESETNFSTINNQQADAIGALVEKPINSIDAIMMKECMLSGIDPESPIAPKTMVEAIEKLFNVKDGDISNLDDKQMRQLAYDIRIIAEGDKKKPNIVIADLGEGQNPSDFKQTLLSLHRKNKLHIQFVQGKYGMGGTGVISFCGNNKYELILSRRCPKILKQGQKDLWGFTLIRRTPASKLSERDRHSWYECLVDQKMEILSFEGEPLAILPKGESLEYGCYVKLFNYDLPHPSFATRDLAKDLNRKLYSPALPILIQEARTDELKIEEGKNDTRVLIGNRLTIQKAQEKFVRATYPIITDLKQFGNRIVDVVVFRDFNDKNEKLSIRNEWTTYDEAVFLTINGQTHHTLDRHWLRKTDLDYLIEYLFVHIDCTNVSKAVTDDIFLGSRDRVRNNEVFRAFEDALISALKTNEVLQKLNEEYRQRALADIRPDEGIAKQLIMSLISKNRTLASYFLKGTDVPSGTTGTDTEIPSTYQGVYIPTFLRPAKKFTGKCLVKGMPKNARHTMVLLETDAQTDYLNRKENRGKLTWSSNDARARVPVSYLFNGLLFLRVNVLDPIEGEEFDFNIELSRPHMEPLTVDFKIKIGEAEEGIEHEERQRRQRGINLPKLVPVRQTPTLDKETSWEQLGWNASDIAKVDKEIVYVNMDSNDLRTYMNQCPKRLRDTAELVYKTGIYLNSIILDMEFKKMESPDGVWEKAFRAAIASTSKTLLPMYMDKKIQEVAREAEQAESE